MKAAFAPLGKLSPPALAPWIHGRQPLIDRVLGAVGPLVVLHAGAGFGKSTLMAQCHAACSAQGVVALWLTLDRGDADLARLLQSLTWALEPVLVPGPPGPGALLDRVAQAMGRWVLFIDEVEHLPGEREDAGGLALLAELVRRLPRGGRVVLASRRLPAPPGLVCAGDDAPPLIDEGALRLGIDDARALLVASASARPDDAVLARLHARTEGWPLGLVMALGGMPVNDGAHPAVPPMGTGPIDDYLAEEVLGKQPPALRDFMLRTSVLQTLSLPVCQVLCPQLDAQQALLQLEASRSFVLRVGGAEPAWRYHRLFADFLRSSLQRESPVQYTRMHRLAAGWHASQGRPAPTIEHAIAGDDRPMALSVLERSAESFLAQDRFRLLLRWFDALGTDALVGRPLLQATHAWCVCLTQGTPQTRDLLSRYRLNSHTDAQVQAHVAALQAMLLAKEDRYAQALDVATQAAAQWSDASGFAAGVLSSLLAHVSFVLGRPQPVGLLALRGEAGNRFERNYHQTTLGMIDLQAGQLRRAQARMQAALNLRHEATGAETPNPWLAVPYAATLYERGEFALAVPLLAVHMAAARDASMPDHMICAAVLRSRMAHAGGDIAQALEFLVELEHDGMQRQLPRVAASAHLERARLLLLCGRHDAAAQALDRAETLFDWSQVATLALPAHDTECPRIGRVRLCLALGRSDDAAVLLQQAAAQAGARQPRRMKLAVLGAAVAWQQGKLAVAGQALRPVLKVCADQGYLRIVLDEGLLLAPLLQRVRLEAAQGQGASPDPMLCDLVDRMLAMLGMAPRAVDPPRDPDSALTRKELDVLQALSEGCSNQDICERLGISDSTVRTHLRKINSKLGAQSRSQAVALGRRLQLLP